MSQTVTQQLQFIHRTYEGSTDYPEVGSDDYELRLSLLGDAVRIWGDDSTKWRELYTLLEDAADGDKTTTANDAILNAPADFMRPASFLKINGEYYLYQTPQKTFNTQRIDSSAKYFTVTGKPGAYKLNVNPAPASTGLAIVYPYYREPTIPSSGSNVLEMSRPLFASYFVLARLYEQDNRNDLVSFYEQKMSEQNDLMVLENVRYPEDTPFTVPDIYNRLYGSGFGV